MGLSFCLHAARQQQSRPTHLRAKYQNACIPLEDRSFIIMLSMQKEVRAGKSRTHSRTGGATWLTQIQAHPANKAFVSVRMRFIFHARATETNFLIGSRPSVNSWVPMVRSARSPSRSHKSQTLPRVRPKK